MAVQLTQEMIAGAQATERKYGVPASITLGQIMLESGGSYEGGLSGLAVKAKNLFGIKGTGTAGSVTMNTMEQGANGLYATQANFRKYNSYAESIEDHGKLLTNANYTRYTKDAKTVEEYAVAIHKAGYATDANYANKLISIINSNNLKQYDGGSSYSVPEYTGTETLQNVTSSGNGEVTEEVKLDFGGQILRFILILGLIILAIIFFFSAFGVSMTSVSPVSKVTRVKSPSSGAKTSDEGVNESNE